MKINHPANGDCLPCLRRKEFDVARNLIAIEPATGIMHPPMRHLNSQQKF
jgi:hypothetical protein